MLIRYARVLTQDQDNTAQIAALKSAACELIFEEKSRGCCLFRNKNKAERGRGFKNEAEEYYMELLLQLVNQCLSRVIISQVNLLSLSSISPEGYQFAKNTFEMEQI